MTLVGRQSGVGASAWPSCVALPRGPVLWPCSMALPCGPVLWPCSVTLLRGPVLCSVHLAPVKARALGLFPADVASL